ncbi:MAG: MFS transporter [Fimbriimonadaceae bacterium]|nr:MFS transporter [Fimbriimonadaceae bacterium]
MAAPDDQTVLSWRERWCYCAGEFAPNACGLIVPAYALLVYRGHPATGQPELVSAGLFAVVFTLARLLDGVSDPLVGWLSDRTQTRWGRRRPYLAGSLLPLVLTFILLWLPPSPQQAAVNGLWLLLWCSAFFVCFTLYYAPYLALLPELTPNSQERNRVATGQAICKVLGLIAAALFPQLYAMFGAPPAASGGYLRPALVIGGLGLITLALPLLGRREQPVTRPPSAPLFGSIGEAFASRPFRHFVGAFLACWWGVQVILAILPQLPAGRLGVAAAHNGSVAGLLTAVAIVSGAATFPLCSLLLRRIGRPRTFRLSLVWFAVTAPLLALATSTAGAVVCLLLAAPAIGAFLVLPHALMADVCDHDAAQHGIRREALFFGVQGLVIKAGLALAVVTADQLLTFGGRTVDQPLGFQSCCAFAGLAAALGWVVFRGFEEAGSDHVPTASPPR